MEQATYILAARELPDSTLKKDLPSYYIYTDDK